MPASRRWRPIPLVHGGCAVAPHHPRARRLRHRLRRRRPGPARPVPIVAAALRGLACVKHRGAVAADARTADGCGPPRPDPRRPLRRGQRRGHAVRPGRRPPRRPSRPPRAAEGLDGRRLARRRRPTTTALGDLARAHPPRRSSRPSSPPPTDAAPTADERRRLPPAPPHRRRPPTGTYVASCSFRTIVYKGLAAADAPGRLLPRPGRRPLRGAVRHLPPALLDQHAADLGAGPALPHAVPQRRDQRHRRATRTACGRRAALGTEEAGLGPEELFRPVLDPDDSDSGKLDEAVELLDAGRPRHPPRHGHARARGVGERRATSTPRSAASTGTTRPSWSRGTARPASSSPTASASAPPSTATACAPCATPICEDGLVVCCSEVGAVDVSGHGTVERGRLGPGQMLFVDPDRGRPARRRRCKERLAAGAPYARWAADGLLRASHRASRSRRRPTETSSAARPSHGYTKEELAMVLKPMAADAHEPTFSMGDDSPLPHLAGRPRPVHHYLRQRFAQVTNPPIDPLRERLVMSLRTLLGPAAAAARRAPPRPPGCSRLESFFLYPVAASTTLDDEPARPFADRRRSTPRSPWPTGPTACAAAVERLADEAEAAVAGGRRHRRHRRRRRRRRPGARSRRCWPAAPCTTASSTPAAAADASLVVRGRRRPRHPRFAALLGYGADAICPRLALETVAGRGRRQRRRRRHQPRGPGPLPGRRRGRRAQDPLEDGHLHRRLVPGRPDLRGRRPRPRGRRRVLHRHARRSVGGIGWDAARRRTSLDRHAAACGRRRVDLESPGFYRVRKGGEYHAHRPRRSSRPSTTSRWCKDAGRPTAQADGHGRRPPAAAGHHRRVATTSTRRSPRWSNDRPPTELHDLLELVAGRRARARSTRSSRPPSIARRFSTGRHVPRVAVEGGPRDPGPGHEPARRPVQLRRGRRGPRTATAPGARAATTRTRRSSRSPRAASASRPSTWPTPTSCRSRWPRAPSPARAASCPATRCPSEIARLRHTQPGVGLISPPPHHDIYSIEDLAQLIYDLKQVNAAQVSVKLVAEDGVGTIAAGVRQGAGRRRAHQRRQRRHRAPARCRRSSTPGMPWELGPGRHPAGARRQRPARPGAGAGRRRVHDRPPGDRGRPARRRRVLVRHRGDDRRGLHHAAGLPPRHLQARRRHPAPAPAGQLHAARPRAWPPTCCSWPRRSAGYLAALGAALARRGHRPGRAAAPARPPATPGPTPSTSPPLHRAARATPTAPRRFVERVAAAGPALRPRRPAAGRRLPARVGRRRGRAGLRRSPTPTAPSAPRSSGAIALEYGDAAAPGHATCASPARPGRASAPSSTHGVELDLIGEANDYVGKGMGGGRTSSSARRPNDAGRRRRSLAGNTCLYGATGGELFVAGAVGERFARAQLGRRWPWSRASATTAAST